MAEALGQQSISPVGGVGRDSGNAMADAQGRVNLVLRWNMKLAGKLESIGFQANFLYFYAFQGSKIRDSPSFPENEACYEPQQ